MISKTLKSKHIGFFGAGNMAEALAKGLLAGKMPAANLLACDLKEARRKYFKNTLGVPVTNDNRKVVRESDIAVFAVKPQDIATVLAIISPVPTGKLFISICAGVSTKFIEKQLTGKPHVIRAMPNTPMLVGAGAAAIAPGKHATKTDLKTARSIFEAAAEVVEVEEDMMDAVTAVSGSGPAYFFYLTEALAKAGEKLGLPPEEAMLLARQTACGAGRLLEGSEDTPEALRKKVTSPGGTTFAAIAKMNEAKISDAFIAAVEAAAARSKEIGR